MPTVEQRAIIERWFREIFEQGNLGTVDVIVAPDFVAHPQGDGQAAHGREVFKDWLRWYRGSFTEPEWTIEDVIADRRGR